MMLGLFYMELLLIMSIKRYIILLHRLIIIFKSFGIREENFRITLGSVLICKARNSCYHNTYQSYTKNN